MRRRFIVILRTEVSANFSSVQMRNRLSSGLISCQAVKLSCLPSRRGTETPVMVTSLFYLLALPPLMAKTLLKNIYYKMGFIRYNTFVFLLLAMMSLPIKMYLRWAINFKYMVNIPEFFFNI